MIEVSLENNPLIQLNLLLWMSLNGKESWLNPYFNKMGYEILVIEPELPLPPKHVNILNQNNIEFIDNPKPEVILLNKENKNYFIIECKNQCFNLDNKDTRSTKQVVSFLIYNADLISESFGIEAENYIGLLNYNFMKNDFLTEFSQKVIEMQENLNELFNENINLPSTSYFFEKDETLYLKFIDPKNTIPEISDNNQIKVMSLKENNILAPLYLIPIDSSGNTDKYGEIVFYKRIKSNFGVFLGKLNNLIKNENIILDIEKEILKNIINVWDIWNNAETKKYIRNQTRLYLNKIISKLEKKIDTFSYQSINNGYNLDIQDKSTVEELRKEFLKVNIKRENKAVKNNQLNFNFSEDDI